MSEFTKNEFEGWEILQDEYVVLLPPNVKINSHLTWKDLTEYQPIMIAGLPCGASLHEHLKLVAPFLNTLTFSGIGKAANRGRIAVTNP